MSKTTGNEIAPLDLVADFGVDGFRYHFLADTPFGPDGDFSYEGMVARYNADLANNLGNLLSRVATVVDKKCGGVGPAPRADSPLAAAAADAVRGDRRGVGRRRSRAAPSTRRGASSARPTPTSRPTSRGRPSPAPAVDAVLGDALEALRIVAILASPAIPGDRPDDLGAHRPAGRRRRPAPARGRRVGRLPGRAHGRQGRRRCSRASTV